MYKFLCSNWNFLNSSTNIVPSNVLALWGETFLRLHSYCTLVPYISRCYNNCMFLYKFSIKIFLHTDDIICYFFPPRKKSEICVFSLKMKTENLIFFSKIIILILQFKLAICKYFHLFHFDFLSFSYSLITFYGFLNIYLLAFWVPMFKPLVATMWKLYVKRLPLRETKRGGD